MGRDVCLLHQEHNEHPEQKLELEYRNSLEERECKNTRDDKSLSGCLHPVVISSWDTVDFHVGVGVFWGFFGYLPCAKVLWDWEGIWQPFVTGKTNPNVFCDLCKAFVPVKTIHGREEQKPSPVKLLQENVVQKFPEKRCKSTAKRQKYLSCGTTTQLCTLGSKFPFQHHSKCRDQCWRVQRVGRKLEHCNTAVLSLPPVQMLAQPQANCFSPWQEPFSSLNSRHCVYFASHPKESELQDVRYGGMILELLRKAKALISLSFHLLPCSWWLFLPAKRLLRLCWEDDSSGLLVSDVSVL